MSFLLRVAWRNLWRHRRRSLLTATAMGVGVAMCMAMLALTDGMFAKMFDVMVTDAIGHVQVHHPDYPATQQLHDTIPAGDALLAETVDGADGVTAATGRLFAFGLLGSEKTSAGARFMGVAPGREAAVSGVARHVEDGRWLAEDGHAEAVLGAGLADTLEAELGAELVIITQAADGSMGNALVRVVGIARTGNTAMDRGGAWLRLGELQELLALEGQLHELVLLTDDVDEIGPTARALAARPPLAALLVRPWFEANPQAAEMLGSQDVSKGIMLFIVFTVSALGVLNTMLMSVFERTRELGVLRALGLARGRLMGLVMVESVLLASLSCLGGLLLGAALDAYLVLVGIDMSAGGEGLSFAGVTFDPVIKGVVAPGGIVLTLSCVFVVSLLASIWPALRAARLEPVEAMRQL